MASFRVTITEIQPAGEIAAPQEKKVFEQVVEYLDVARFAREFNKPVRVRRSRAKNAAPAA